ncbi:hypothetical protein CAPN001_22320 [Capnocytophaga stomatis]|uniref:hypothetical protein n=1 Tax=Capnocytophaga stomatis TaxID=1848904 RepID=UPI00194EC9B2|nr:hypothetical protein [Capnocytophaga stomatis]GIJ97663.1 hypothetical protein CAPN001_22320 [Capnocytophaga stomatis]
MVAKIHRGSNLLGVLLYNHNKLDKQEATILHTQNIIQPVNGNIGTSEITRSFAPYLFANQKTEKQPNGVKYSFLERVIICFFIKLYITNVLFFLGELNILKNLTTYLKHYPILYLKVIRFFGLVKKIMSFYAFALIL